MVLPVVILYEVANGTDERQDKDDEEKQDLISLVTMSTVVEEVFLNLGPLNSSWVADTGTGSVCSPFRTVFPANSYKCLLGCSAPI